MKRRLLSLIMAMVMVCSLVPTALAVGEDDEPVTPTAPNLSISISGSTSTKVGSTLSLTATPSGHGEEAVTYAWTTTSSDISISDPSAATATISCTATNPSENVTAAVTCTATIGEGGDGKQDAKTVDVTFRVPKVTGIELNPDSLDLVVGDAAGKTITATVTGTDLETADKSVTWTLASGGSEFVELSETGTTVTVKPKKEGSATILATSDKDSSFFTTCRVSVKANEDKYELAITGGSTVVVNETVKLTATVKKNGTTVTRPDVVWSSSNESIATVDKATGAVKGVARGDATITAAYSVDGKKVAEDTHDITVTKGVLTIIGGKSTLNSYNDTMTLRAQFNGEDLGTNAKLEWTVDKRTYVELDPKTSGSVTVTAKKETPKDGVTIEATYQDDDGDKYTATKTIYVEYSNQNAATVTVYTSTSEYYLDNSDDEGGSSIESQLDSYFSSRNSEYFGLESVEFSGKTNAYGNLSVTTGRKYYASDADVSSSNYFLSDAYFTPTKKGSAVFNITANVYRTSSHVSTDAVTCTITFKVEDGTSGGDVVVYASLGEEVYLDSSDFEDFWDDQFSGGSLDYVTFGSVSGGSLLDEDDKSAGSKKFYVTPGRNDLDLDEVHFKPNSTTSKKATTISISFTAYGENSKRVDKNATGTLSIVYMSDSPKDINYTVGANGSVNLKASDFTAAYREATGSAAPTNLTIVFQSVPKNGTLTYTDSSKKNSSAVTLKSNSIKSRNFTTKSSGTNQIGDVTYTGKTGTDTIEYIAYSGSTPKFKGNVVFNGTASTPKDILVTFQSVSGQPATFSQDAFIRANSALAGASKYRFALPANGSLYLNGTTNAAGVDILSTLLGSVTYRPKAGYNGTDKITFIAYDANNTMVGSGTVNVTVAGNPTTTSGGVTNASQFTDVKSDAWYFTYLSDLVSKGIISGRGDGTFDPTGTVTYGEALKMVLEAAGYTAAVGTGNDWAINYKNLAVSRGWIGSNITLTAPISREATAELIARVLGVSSSSSASPFTDTTNGYAVALYYTNPQIFIGDTSSGQRLFNTNQPLLRQEVCTIIYRMNAYYLAHTSTGMPDGI